MAILAVGLLWAGLTKDPLGPGFFIAVVPLAPVATGRDRSITGTLRGPGTRPAALAAAGLVVLAGAIALSASPLAAQDDDEFAAVELEVLGNIPWQEGQRLSATVTVRTERAVSGKLTVSNNPEGGSSTSYEFDIDVAANTTGVFPLTLTTGWNGVEARAVLEANGEAVAQDQLSRRPNGGDEVGILATLGFDDPPRRVDEIGGETQLASVPLDGRLVGLESASSLVAAPADIRDLQSDDDQLNRLQGWIQGGGQLIVDGPTASLDDLYHHFPTANPNRFAYGAGSIVYAEDWRDGIPLGGYQGSGGLRNLVESQGLGSGSSGELGLLAGITLPGVTVIAGVLLLYTVLAGPLLFGFVSTKKIQRRIWVILPALSLLFVVGIVGFGFISRSGNKDVHITIVEVHDQGSRATSNLLLTSSIGGDRTIEVPSNWTYLGQARTEGQRPTLLRVGSSNTDVSFEVPPGSNATARVLGAVPEYDGALTIGNIRLAGDELTADVTNNGLADLTESLIFFGNARSEVGDIPAGETVSVSVAAHDDSTRTMHELLLWPRVEQSWTNSGAVAVPVDRDALTAAGAWTEWRIEQGLSAVSEGVLAVVGWTDDLPAPIGGVEVGRTALFARANIDSEVLSPVGYSTALRLPNRQSEPVFQDNFAGYPQDYRIALAPGADVQRLAVRATRSSAGLAFLVDGDWQFATLGESGDVSVAIPAGAVKDGEIRFRSYEADWSWGVGVTALVVVDDEDAKSFDLSSVPSFRNPEGGGGFDGGFEQDMRFEEVEAIEVGGFAGEIWAVVDLGPLESTDPVTTAGELPAPGYDQFLFSISEGQSVRFLMESEEGDPYLELFDSGGELLSSDDDSGSLANSELEFTSASGGDYELRAINRGDQMIYDLTIEVSE